MAHTHRYTKINIARDGNKPYWVMQCNLPGCKSYTPGKSKLSFPRLKGQITLCNKCGEKFVLDKRALRSTNPICIDCVKKKENPKQEAAEDFFDSLMKGIKDGINS